MTRESETRSIRSELRLRFIEVVASADLPLRPRNLIVKGISKRALQKRLRELRQRAGGAEVHDSAVIEFARPELAKLQGPLSRGQTKLARLASTAAADFVAEAGRQMIVIGDWIEVSHSPDDTGWARDQISVREMARGTTFARGRAQSWMTEKKAFLKDAWESTKRDASARRNLIPNQEKMDIVNWRLPGVGDSKMCGIDIAPVDWQTCLALNARLDRPGMSGSGGEHTIRESWARPEPTLERRSIPGMAVAHIVVETLDERFLVCQRQLKGIEDERGKWSLSIEERWTGPLHGLFDRSGGEIQRPREGDAHPHDVVTRAVSEELGITVRDQDVLVLAWGLEYSVLYPGFIALVRVSLGSWQIEGLHQHAPDSNELRFVTSVPADQRSIALLLDDDFQPFDRPDLRRRWHRTSKARLLAALAHVLNRDEALGGGRQAVLEVLGSLS